MQATTLTALMQANRNAERSITYLEGEKDVRRVSYDELHQRALGILHHLQRLGAKPGRPADPAPGQQRAVHRRVLGLPARRHRAGAGGRRHQRRAPPQAAAHRAQARRSPFIYTDRKPARAHRPVRRAGGRAPTTFERLRRRTFLVDELDDISRAGRPHAARPEDIAFIQFSSGSTSDPKGVVLTHANLIANMRRRDPGGALQRRRRQPVVDAADARHGPDRLPPGDVREPRAHAPDAHRAVRAPPAAVAAVRLAASAPRSCARPTSATGTT